MAGGAERLGRVSMLLKADVEKGTVRDPETKQPMTRDTIFRIYSMTKPIRQGEAAYMMQAPSKRQYLRPILKNMIYGAVTTSATK